MGEELTLSGLLGLGGALLGLVALAMLLAGRWDGATCRFAGLALAAALLVTPALAGAFGAVGAVVAGLWAAIGLAGIARLRLGRSRMKIGADEEPIVEALVPGLPSDRARVLLSLGEWRELGPGQALTTEGQPVRWLAYVAEGNCVVERDGERVASLGPQSLIGEMTFLSGAPATATVRTVGTTRIFRFEVRQLRRALERHEDIRAALEHNLLSVLGLRLRETTGQMARLRRVFDQAGMTPRRKIRRR